MSLKKILEQTFLQAQHLPTVCHFEAWPGYKALTLSEQGMTILYLCHRSGNTDDAIDHSGPSDFWLVSGKFLGGMVQPWVVYSWICSSLRTVV